MPQFLYVFARTYYFLVFHGCPKAYDVVTLCSSDLYVPSHPGVNSLFIFLLVISVSFLEKCLLKSSTYVLSQFWCCFRSSFYILDISTWILDSGYWYQIYDLQIFFPILWFVFSLCFLGMKRRRMLPLSHVPNPFSCLSSRVAGITDMGSHSLLFSTFLMSFDIQKFLIFFFFQYWESNSEPHIEKRFWFW